jgi:hypothetical protein
VIHRLQLFCLTASILTSQSRFGLRLPLAQRQKDFQLSRRPVFQGSSSLATGTSLVSEDRQGQVARYPPHARHHTEGETRSRSWGSDTAAQPVEQRAGSCKLAINLFNRTCTLCLFGATEVTPLFCFPYDLFYVELSQFENSTSRALLFLVMILPQVHLRKPCYDFYFL